MQYNIKKTKQLLIGSAKKPYHTEKTTLELSIENTRLEQEKSSLVSSLILTSRGRLHIDCLIKKLTSRILPPQESKSLFNYWMQKNVM